MQQFWLIFAGLGLFLFGMGMMEEALKNLAGRSFKIFLRKHTNTPIKSILSGAIATAILQSSTLLTLLVMSLAGAGVLGLQNGIGMILGANLGTTTTGWLVALIGFKMDMEKLLLPLLGFGGLGLAFISHERIANFCRFMLGFGFMFLGTHYMKTSFEDLPARIDLSCLVDKPLFLFTIFGFVLTAIIHSSAASMTIYLASLATGVISLPQAAYLMIGSDWGTSITAVTGTLNGNAARRRVGWAQFYFNFLNAMVTLLLVDQLFYVIHHWLGISDPLAALVMFHTLFNLLGILVMLPLLGTFTRLLEKYITKDKKGISKHLHPKNAGEQLVGVEALEQETQLFVQKVLATNQSFFQPPNNPDFLTDYAFIKQYEQEISGFYLLLQQSKLTENNAIHIHNLLAIVRNASLSVKDLKDIKHNFDTLGGLVERQAQAFQTEICTYQAHFYAQLQTLLPLNFDNSTASSVHIQSLQTAQQAYYQNQTQAQYQFLNFATEELDISSQLNLLRGISKSNESFIHIFLLPSNP